jgi:hypothetical protein
MNSEIRESLHLLTESLVVLLAIITLNKLNTWLDRQDEAHRAKKGLFEPSALKAEDN